jgi:hypothetical protein
MGEELDEASLGITHILFASARPWVEMEKRSAAAPDVRLAMRTNRLRRSHRHGRLAGHSGLALLLFILPCREVLASFVFGAFKQARPGNDGCGQLEANSVRIEEVN